MSDRDLLAEMERIAEIAVRDVVFGVDAGIQVKLTGQRSGVKYPNLPNRSSAPGEPPATQSGRLKNTRRATATGKKGEIVYDCGYAAPLEYGTSRMKPRPFVKPVLDNLDQLDILRGL